MSLVLVHPSNKSATVCELTASSSKSQALSSSNSVEIRDARVFRDLNGIEMPGMSLIIFGKEGLSIDENAISSETVHRVMFCSKASMTSSRDWGPDERGSLRCVDCRWRIIFDVEPWPLLSMCIVYTIQGGHSQA